MKITPVLAFAVFIIIASTLVTIALAFSKKNVDPIRAFELGLEVAGIVLIFSACCGYPIF